MSVISPRKRGQGCLAGKWPRYWSPKPQGCSGLFAGAIFRFIGRFCSTQKSRKWPGGGFLGATRPRIPFHNFGWATVLMGRKYVTAQELVWASGLIPPLTLCETQTHIWNLCGENALNDSRNNHKNAIGRAWGDFCDFRVGLPKGIFRYISLSLFSNTDPYREAVAIIAIMRWHPVGIPGRGSLYNIVTINLGPFPLPL